MVLSFVILTDRAFELLACAIPLIHSPASYESRMATLCANRVSTCNYIIAGTSGGHDVQVMHVNEVECAACLEIRRAALPDW